MSQTTKQTPVSEWMTLREIADMARISLSAAERLKASRDLPPHAEHGPRLHRWRRRDVEKWLNDKVERPAGR